MVSSKAYIKKKAEETYFADPDKITDDVVEIMHEAAHLGGSSAKYFYASVRCHFTDMYVGNAIKQLNHSIFVIGAMRRNPRKRYASIWIITHRSNLLLFPAFVCLCILKNRNRS